MSSRYSKKHYEDVARILKEQATYYSGIVNDGQAIVAGVVLGRTIQDFADLFTADNPKCCIHCGYVKGTTEICDSANGQLRDEHTFEYGFDREQFLAACGLKSEG